MSNNKPHFVTADWKDITGLAEEFISFLESEGYKVYEDPSLEGSDTFGWVISKKDLSKKQLQNASNEHWGNDVN